MRENPIEAFTATYRANFDGFINDSTAAEFLNSCSEAVPGAEFDIAAVKRALKELAAERGSKFSPKTIDLTLRYKKIITSIGANPNAKPNVSAVDVESQLIDVLRRTKDLDKRYEIICLTGMERLHGGDRPDPENPGYFISSYRKNRLFFGHIKPGEGASAHQQRVKAAVKVAEAAGLEFNTYDKNNPLHAENVRRFGPMVI